MRNGGLEYLLGDGSRVGQAQLNVRSVIFGVPAAVVLAWSVNFGVPTAIVSHIVFTTESCAKGRRRHLLDGVRNGAHP